MAVGFAVFVALLAVCAFVLRAGKNRAGKYCVMQYKKTGAVAVRERGGPQVFQLHVKGVPIIKLQAAAEEIMQLLNQEAVTTEEAIRMAYERKEQLRDGLGL